MKALRPLLYLVVATAISAEPLKTADGYSLPQPGRQFIFPQDHGSHPDFKIEWWYITGHLYSEDGRRFGLQATFFRRGDESPQHRNLYLAHMALLDVKNGRFIHQERLNREGWDARSAIGSLDVQCGPWTLRMDDAGAIQLAGSVHADASFTLSLKPSQPLVVFGENGVSRKGADASAASHYLTFPRLASNGTLSLGSEQIAVQGELWMDHEMSSSQLDEGQVGWDWACLQLKDGREVMVYRMRRRDGTPDPFSTVSWVDPRGIVTQQSAKDFSLTPTATWHSPHTGATYPSGVTLAAIDPLTGKPVRWKLVPLAQDQELTGRITGIAYWEGACRILDEHDQEIGSAFLELTGYTGDLRRGLR